MFDDPAIAEHEAIGESRIELPGHGLHVVAVDCSEESSECFGLGTYESRSSFWGPMSLG
jgi:hypothetical protein